MWFSNKALKIVWKMCINNPFRTLANFAHFDPSPPTMGTGQFLATIQFLTPYPLKKTSAMSQFTCSQALVFFFSNFRSIAATNTRTSFNGEIRQRTSNTGRQEQWYFSSKDLLNDLFQQELHHFITGQRTLISKICFCGNSHTRIP